jgi:outer membrane protein OmpA-like peptidoglycan-associated protein
LGFYFFTQIIFYNFGTVFEKPSKNNIMKKISTLFGILLLGFSLTAQENLVPNPSFEEVEGKIKEGGLIEMAIPWKSVTMNPVDLYSAKAKNDEYSVPENKNGSETASTGSNYAGVTFFGYGGRIPRTYLGAPLSKELEAGKQYCMKFHVNLSDYSKYAVNNLAMYVAKEEMTEKKDGNLIMVPHMKSMKNNVEDFEKQYVWTAICGVYNAEGGEKFIAIGNFDADGQTDQKKIRLSKEFMGKRQQNSAYYFVDDVSVVELTEKTLDDCLCDKIAGGKMKTEFKSFGTDENKRASAKKTHIVNSDGTKAETKVVAKKVEVAFSIETAEVYFASKLAKIEEKSNETVEGIVKYLNENSGSKVLLTGHIDASESAMTSLAKKRAYILKKKLIELGISDDRISYVTVNATKPKEKGNAAANQRVSVSLK